MKKHTPMQQKSPVSATPGTQHPFLCTSVFGIGQESRAAAVVGLLEAFFQTTWIHQTVIGSVIDTAIISDLQLEALLELRALFNSRLKKPNTSCDVHKFLTALVNSTPPDNLELHFGAKIRSRFPKNLDKKDLATILGHLRFTYEAFIGLLQAGFPAIRALENAFFDSIATISEGKRSGTGTTAPKKISPFVVIATPTQSAVPETINLNSIFGFHLEYALNASCVDYGIGVNESNTPFSSETRCIYRMENNSASDWYEHTSPGHPQLQGKSHNAALTTTSRTSRGEIKPSRFHVYIYILTIDQRKQPAGKPSAEPLKRKQTAVTDSHDRSFSDDEDIPGLTGQDNESQDGNMVLDDDDDESEYNTPSEDTDEHYDEYDEDDDEDDDEDEDEEDEDDMGDEDDEIDNRSPSKCQCPTCKRDRNKKKEQSQKKIEVEKLVHAAKKAIVLGTGSTRYTKTVLADAQRKFLPDGMVAYKDNYLINITAMNIYNHKCNDELRWEDYYIKDGTLKAVKCILDSEMRDREREERNRSLMERDDHAMHLWSGASDKAWKKFQKGLEVYNKKTAESRSTAGELFSLALRTCISGPHAVQCYLYRALCNLVENPSQAMSDCRVVLQHKKNDPQAHYYLGSLMLTNPLHDDDTQYERAQFHLETALQNDPSIFSDDPSRHNELQLAKEKAAHQRLVNAAEVQKNAGNAALLKGNFVEAEELYSTAFKICPNGEKSYIYLCNRATARCEMATRSSNKVLQEDLLQQSLRDCEACLVMNANYVKALFRRAFCLGAMKMLKEDLNGALVHYNEALKFDTNNAGVKQEIKRITTTLEAAKARELAMIREKEIAEKEAQKAEQREREKKLAEEKRAREELERKEKAQKLAAEKAEQALLKKEREAAKAEREKELATEKEKEKERLKAEKEAQKAIREQEKIEERERKRLEREAEKEREKQMKERAEKEFIIKQREKAEKAEQFAKEMSRVSAVVSQAEKPASSATVIATPSVAATHTPVQPTTQSAPVPAPASIAAPVTVAEKPHAPGKPELPPVAQINAISAIGSFMASMASSKKTTDDSKKIASSKSNGSTTQAEKETVKSVASAVAPTIVKQITAHMECPEDRVGIVIGAKGMVINNIMKKTGCVMRIDLDVPKGQLKKVVITGTPDQVEHAKVLVQIVIVHGPNAINNSALTTADLLSSIDKVGKPYGKVAGKLDTDESSTAHENHSHSTIAKLIAAYDDGVGEGECCIICADSMKIGSDRMPAIGACNHKGACSVCLMRMRAIQPKDLSCPMCRTSLDHVVSSYEEKPFVEHNVPKMPSPTLFFDTQSQIYFPKSYYASHIKPLWAHICKICENSFNDSETLRLHYQTSHNLRQCALCIQHRQVFPVEQMVYTVKDFEHHMNHGGGGSEGHPHCTFCNTNFYDKTALFKHVTMEHFTCQLCPREDVTFSYYRDYRMLEDHFRKDHFACEEPECLERKHVAFRSLFELQAHNRSVHTKKGSSETTAAPINSTSFPPLSGEASREFIPRSSARPIAPTSYASLIGAQNSMVNQSHLSSNVAMGSANSDPLSIFASLPPSSSMPMSSIESILMSAPNADSNSRESSYFSGMSSGLSASNLSLQDNGFSSLSSMNNMSNMSSFGLGDDILGFGNLSLGGNLSGSVSNLGGITGSLGRDAQGSNSSLLTDFLQQPSSDLGSIGSGGLGSNMGSLFGFDNQLNSASQNNFSSGFFAGLGLGGMGNDSNGLGLGLSDMTGNLGQFSDTDSLFSRVVGSSDSGSGGDLGGMFSSMGSKAFESRNSMSAAESLPSPRTDDSLTLKLASTSPFRDSSKEDDESHGYKNFPPQTIDRIVKLLRTWNSDGVLGSALPDAYYKKYGEKLRMDTKYGKKVKLLNMVEGHPNIRLTGEKSGSMRLFYTDGPALNEKLSPAAASSPPQYAGEPGIEGDELPVAEANNYFSEVAWLREYDMSVYRWAGNEKEWTEFVLRLRSDVLPQVEASLSNIVKQSGCEMSIEREKLYGQENLFLRFVRGSSGNPSNSAMTRALGLTSQLLEAILVLNEDGSEEGDLDYGGEEAPPHGIDGRVQRVLDIPPSAVGHVYGKNGKKLQLMRRKSGAYITLVPMKSMKGKGPAKLTISGSASAVDLVVKLVKAALVGTADSMVIN